MAVDQQGANRYRAQSDMREEKEASAAKSQKAFTGPAAPRSISARLIFWNINVWPSCLRKEFRRLFLSLIRHIIYCASLMRKPLRMGTMRF
jgi:hypothetical protein